MGLMQGKTDGDAIIVMDAFALPVEGTETRVNAQADAYEYMVDYSQTNKQVSRLLCSFFFLLIRWMERSRILCNMFGYWRGIRFCVTGLGLEGLVDITCYQLSDLASK